MKSIINEIKQKLEKLKSLDPEFKIYGASQHHYILNLPVPEDDIAVFEELAGITLPEDYRLFIKHLGNGGAGPGYDGLFSMENYESFDPQDLENPFILTKLWEPEIDDPIEGNPLNGAMRISDDGCGTDILLVVNGIQKGNVWVDCRESEGGIYPFYKKRKFTFSDWYIQWLDKSVEKLNK